MSDSVATGSTVTLLCMIDANPIELSNVRWFKNNEEITAARNAAQWERRIDGNTASLISKSVRREDAGQYACEIDNPFGNSRATIPLVVQCTYRHGHTVLR